MADSIGPHVQERLVVTYDDNGEQLQRRIVFLYDGDRKKVSTLYGPVRYPPPKKPKLRVKKDAAIDDPRLQALRETGDRELRELRELAKLLPLKRKTTDDELSLIHI